jgi:hypothetical protein
MRIRILLFSTIALFLSLESKTQHIDFMIKDSLLYVDQEFEILNNSPPCFKDSSFIFIIDDNSNQYLLYHPHVFETKGLKSLKHSIKTSGIYTIQLKLKNSTQILRKKIEIKRQMEKQCKNISDNSGKLILNGDFEDFIKCPDNIGQWEQIAHWKSISKASPDYFNSCFQKKLLYNWSVDVPDNFAGSTYPASGNAYAGIIAYIRDEEGKYPSGQLSNYREYLFQELKNPPEKASYIFRISIQLSNKSSLLAPLGIAFSDSLPQNNMPTCLNYPCCIDFQGKTTDTGWIQICDTIELNGNEKYLIIGNFLNDQESPIQVIRPDSLICSNYEGFKAQIAYFYIDNISMEQIPSEYPCMQSINSAGNFFSSDSFSFSCSMGQIFHLSISDTLSGIFFNQGFQQAFDKNRRIWKLAEINKKNSRDTFIIYPNPSTGKFYICFYQKKKDVVLHIFNLHGILQHQQKIEMLDKNPSQIHVQHLNEGLYFLNILKDKQILVQDKLLIIKQ